MTIRILLASYVLLGSALMESTHANELSAVAAEFTAKGMSATLATCRLPKVCNKQVLIKQTKQIRKTGNDNVIDERHLSFDGLKIELVYVLGNNSLSFEKSRYSNPYDNPVILSLTVSSSTWPVLHGLRVGTNRSAVEAKLGRSGSGDDDECVSYANKTTQDEVLVCYEQRKVRSIKWTPWWDG